MEHGDPSAAAAPTASEALIEHRGFVRALARSLMSGRDRADDLAQDALAAGLAQPPKCGRAWRSWLRSTVQRLAWNRLRTQRRVELRERAAAQREALPSAATLVMRLELEQRVVAAVLTLPAPERSVVLLRFYDGQETATIAASLGVPADSVRARLRRALARLREQLDRSCGDRESWQRGLAALTLGGAAMGSKVVVAAMAAGVVAAATWFALPERLGGFRGEEPGLAAQLGAPAVVDGAGDPATPAPDLAEPARVELPPGRGVASTAGVAELKSPGFVAFEVIDAETRVPVSGMTMRFLHESRFGVHHGEGHGQVRLTSGRWSARITVAGYEPAEIEPFDVAIDQVTDLGKVELARGGGRIEGRIAARGVPEDSLQVELHGDGRSPCARCRAQLAKDGDVSPEFGTGEDCGWNSFHSSFALADGDTFRFADLAAGTYWLRAFDEATKLVDLRRVDVERDGQSWVDLDVSRPTSLVVELRHSDGHHFTGVWGHPYREDPARIDFQAEVGETSRGVAHAAPTIADVRSTMGPPGRFDDMVPAEQAKPAAAVAGAELVLEERRADEELAMRQLQVQEDVFHAAVALASFERVAYEERSDGGDRLDRARRPVDALVPEPAAPQLEEIALAAERLRPDSFRIGPLPRQLVRLKVVSDVYASTTIDVDLRHGFTGPLVVTLHPQFEGDPDDPSDDREAFARSCMGCHASAAAARDQGKAREAIELDRAALEAFQTRWASQEASERK